MKNSGRRIPAPPHAGLARRLLTLLIAATAALTACSSGQTSTSSTSGGKVTLTYSLWDDHQEVGYKQAIAQFEKDHPNITVTVVQNGWGAYWTKLHTQLASNTAPDVFTDHVAYFPGFAKQQVLLNLKPYVDKDKVDLSIYYPQLVEQYKYNNGIYGLPKDWDTIALLYNKTAFASAGMPNGPGELAWNPDDGGTLLQVAQKLTVDNSGKHPTDPGFDPKSVKQYGFGSLLGDNGQEYFQNWLAEAGAQMMNKPQFGTKFLFNSPEGIKMWQYFIDLINKYHVSPPANQTNPPNTGNGLQMFQRGALAMIPAGDWNLNSVVAGSNFPVGVALLPSGPAGRVSVFNGLGDGVYAHTKYPQESWELVKYLASDSTERIMAQGGYVWPGISSLDPLFADYWKAKNVDVSPYLQEAKGKTVSFPIVPGFAEASDKIASDLTLAFLGSAPVKKQVDQAVQDGNDALANAG